MHSALWSHTLTIRTLLPQHRDIAQDRVRWAPFMGKAAHLQRTRLADLYLDNFGYSAGSSAVDALWTVLWLVVRPMCARGLCVH